MNINLYPHFFKNYNKSQILEYFFSISLAFAFLGRISKEKSINYFVHIIIAVLLIFVCILISYRTLGRNITKKSYMVISFPIVISLFYNIFLLSIKQVNTLYIGRMLSNYAEMSITVILSVLIVECFNKKSIKILINAIIINFFLILLINVINYGVIDIFIQLFNSIIGVPEARNPLEVHDLTFAAGIILIYLLQDKLSIKREKIILIMIIITGFKRIQLLAFIVVFFIYIFLKYIFKQVNLNKKLIFIGLALIGGSFLFVYLVDSGGLNYISKKFNIQTMGRLAMYEWISLYFSFSVFYLGTGLGTTFKMAEDLTPWGIHALHSDILRVFVEQGFVYFTFWLTYYCIYIPKIIHLNLNKLKYILILSYIMVLHLTDNTLLYFSTQLVFNVLLLLLIENSDSKFVRKNKPSINNGGK